MLQVTDQFMQAEHIRTPVLCSRLGLDTDRYRLSAHRFALSMQSSVHTAVFVKLMKVLQVRIEMTMMAPSFQSQKELTYALLDSKGNGNIWALS